MNAISTSNSVTAPHGLCSFFLQGFGACVIDTNISPPQATAEALIGFEETEPKKVEPLMAWSWRRGFCRIGLEEVVRRARAQ